jgi:hypothetical protein
MSFIILWLCIVDLSFWVISILFYSCVANFVLVTNSFVWRFVIIYFIYLLTYLFLFS